MKALLIAEKPSLKNSIQTAYKHMTFPDKIDFATFAGHIIELIQPADYKKEWAVRPWTWDMLPMIPEKFKYAVSPDKTKLYKELKDTIAKGKYDYLINACDPDREGESIFWRFYNHAGLKLPVKRFWSNDTTEPSCKKGLLGLRDDREPFFQNFLHESTLRAEFDWLVGMNFTVAGSLKMHTVAKIGRVKTPTLKIVVDRENEILNFKPSTTYELQANFEKYSGTYFNDDGIVRFKKKEDADKVLKDLSKNCVIKSVEKKNEKTYAPRLYELNALQQDANRIYGYSAGDTLAIVQSLYEGKLLSYPRTDNPYISSELAKEFTKLIKVGKCISALSAVTDDILKNTAIIKATAKNKLYVDDAKLAESGHTAIVPTGNTFKPSDLTDKQVNIMNLVIKRLLAIFLPPKIESKTTIITDSNGYDFKTLGKIMVDKGFTILYGTSTKDVELPSVKKGDKTILKSTEMVEKTTTAPSRYTEGTLLAAMQNPGKFLHDDSLKSTLKSKKGIGTTATRADIIKQLIKDEYIESKKGKGKSAYLYATAKGMEIISNIKDEEFASVDMTGIWEEKLADIEKGKMKTDAFEKDMKKYVLDEIDNIKKSKMKSVSGGGKGGPIKIIGKCPECGGDIKESAKYYFCSNYRKSCGFIMPTTLWGCKMTETEVKKLLEGEETKEYNFKLKKGNEVKKWSAKLVYSPKDKKITFAKSSSSGSTNSGMKCPVCGKEILESEKYFRCKDYKKGCDFILAKEYFKAKITKTDVKKLLKGEMIEKNFRWKSGKSSKAKLKLDKGRYKFEFN